jgi:hypothetical protein
MKVCRKYGGAYSWGFLTLYGRKINFRNYYTYFFRKKLVRDLHRGC